MDLPLSAARCIAAAARNAGRAFLLFAAALTFSTAFAADAEAAAPVCRESALPVRLSPQDLLPKNRVFLRLCLPPGQRPATVQVLVHGITYSNLYWDFPDPIGGTDRYSYVRAATDAGYATLNMDRIGIGKSSHPPGALLTVDSNAFVVHQVLQALRRGIIPSPTAGVSFRKIVMVGHSYGSMLGWIVATRWPADIEGVLLSGVTHYLPADGAANLFAAMHPAALDPTLNPPVSDPGYLTTLPGVRGNLFHATGPVVPAVVAVDERTKQTLATTELDAAGTIFVTPLDIRVPVLLANGTNDTTFCNAAAGADCSSGAALIRTERPHLGPRVPCLDGLVLPNAGHVINLMPNAESWFAVAQRWVRARIATPAGAPGSCSGAL